MRWPLMTKARHDELVKVYKEAVDREYERAVADGKAMVHAFMRDAQYEVYTHNHPDVAVRAVFQQADREFRPKQLSAAELLFGPANVKEAIDATAGS